MRLFLRLSLLCCLLLTCIPLHAGGRIGLEEKFETIEHVEGTTYTLCYKLSIRHFIAGVWMSDDGYVLRSDFKRDRYIPVDDEVLATLQASGLYKDGLPPYRLTAWNWIYGYMLWWILAICIAALYVKHRLQRLFGMGGPSEPTTSEEERATKQA